MPVAGSTWVEGTYLKWVDSSGVTKSIQGYSLGVVAGAVKGSIWVQGEEVHYIDETTGARRYATGVDLGVIANAIRGSAWLESYTHNIGGSGNGTAVNNNAEETFHFISETNKKRAMHQDTAHSDAYMHNDYAYMHSDYTYMHNDYYYMHNDGPVFRDVTYYMHVDGTEHGDGGVHSDASIHSDGTSPHTDSYMHGDYIDSRGAHGDACARGACPHSDGGNAYYNSYYMHSDGAYMHSDYSFMHTDSVPTIHDDQPNWDHTDEPAHYSGSYHSDGGLHGDGAPHSDTPHTDSPS